MTVGDALGEILPDILEVLNRVFHGPDSAMSSVGHLRAVSRGPLEHDLRSLHEVVRDEHLEGVVTTFAGKPPLRTDRMLKVEADNH